MVCCVLAPSIAAHCCFKSNPCTRPSPKKYTMPAIRPPRKTLFTFMCRSSLPESSEPRDTRPLDTDDHCMTTAPGYVREILVFAASACKCYSLGTETAVPLRSHAMLNFRVHSLAREQTANRSPAAA